MKNYVKISVLVLASIIVVSCNQKQVEQMQGDIKTLTEENEMLRQQALEKDENLNEFFQSMTQIRENLTEIKIKQNLISEETRDKDQVGQDVRQQIEEDLTIINDLMEDNRKRLAWLNSQLRDSNVKIEEFETLVANLTTEIEERNIELSMLRDNMTELNIYNEALAETIDNLEEENKEKNQLIEEKTKQLNAAYFVYGTRNELQEQEIIDRQGGVLGIGRTTVVNSNANKDFFTQVDISQTERVELPNGKLKLVSTHPNDSYIIETNQEQAYSQLVIEDPDKFWSNTRYLVVSID